MRSITLDEMNFIAGGADDEPIQQVFVVGQRDTSWWDSFLTDMEPYFTDGYLTVGWIEPMVAGWGLGGSITYTTDRDIVISALAGTGGPIFALGIVPVGEDPSEYMSGIGIGANVVPGQGGIAAPVGSSGLGNPTINIGTSGISGGISISVSGTAAQIAEASDRIYREAIQYGGNTPGQILDSIPIEP